MVDIKKYSDIDLYGLIGVDCSATKDDIRKGYRKKALECHPDKNPDPKAAELFLELSKALEILSDASARAAYDKILNAKKAAQIRNKQLDSKRKKLKADLEEREKAANSNIKISSGVHKYKVNKSDEEQLRDEIERLRSEGSKLLEEEQELMRNQLRQERQKVDNHYDSSKHRIKIKWKTEKNEHTKFPTYNEENLRNFLKKYGDIVVLVMSPKKDGSALVEFKTQEAGEMAIAYEKGNIMNPLQLNWIGPAPIVKSNRGGVISSTIKDTDYETLVLRQMRQAEERKRLIEQMMQEDNS